MKDLKQILNDPGFIDEEIEIPYYTPFPEDLRVRGRRGARQMQMTTRRKGLIPCRN